MFGSEKLKGLIYDSPDSIKSYELGEVQSELCLDAISSDLTNYDIDRIKKKQDMREELENEIPVVRNSWQQMIITRNIAMGNKNLYNYQPKKDEAQVDER